MPQADFALTFQPEINSQHSFALDEYYNTTGAVVPAQLTRRENDSPASSLAALPLHGAENSSQHLAA
jgi:hypothetical protein